jgi:hypothetical protein
MFGMRMWGIYEGTALYAPLLVVGFLIWGLSILTSKHTVYEYILYLLLMGLAGLVYIRSGEKGLLLYFTLMLGVKYIDTKKLFRVGVIVGGMGMACLCFLSSFGLIEDLAYLQNRKPFGLIFRRSLGLPHPNTLSTSFVVISAMVLFMVGYKNKKKVLSASILLFVISFYLFLYSGSRTGIIFNTGLIILNLIYAYRQKLGIIEKAIAIIELPVLSLMSIVIPIVVPEPTLRELLNVDKTFVFRFIIGKSHYEHTPLTLFGSRLNNPDQPIYGIDLSQLYLFLQLGIIAFVIITILQELTIVEEVKQNRISELVITVVFLFMGLTDPFLYNISYKNILFVFIGKELFAQLAKCEERLPEFLLRSIQPIKLPDIKLKGLLDPDASEGKFSMMSGKKNVVTIAASVLVFTIVAAAYFVITPDPDYVLSDSNKREHQVLKVLEGDTYSEQEIEEIKSDGNIVLNYTDENELMYKYYADENEPIEGGYLAPNAGRMEKARRGISIVLWGTVAVWLVSFCIQQFKNNRGEVAKWG